MAASAREKSAYAAIREFIQNSLDAAIEAKQKCAITRFEIGQCKTSEIPGIEEYKIAFSGVRDFLKHTGQLNGQKENIVNAIAKELRKDQINTLCVKDNGIGFNDGKMKSVLSKGSSDKPKGTGSHGVGHETAFGLSTLRYVLYGGVRENGDMIAAGHAMLASHKDNDDISRESDGYYVTALLEDLFEPFSFIKGEKNIHPLLVKPLRSIQNDENYGQGSAVLVLGFNFFSHEPNQAQEKIRQVAAQNFFPAIKMGKLSIEIIDSDGALTTVDCDDLEKILNSYRERKRAEDRGFPSGRTAAESFDTLTKGDMHTLPYGNGDITIYLRKNAAHKTNIALCRNGMWITDDYNRLGKSKFTDKVPFDALILIDEKAGDIGKVIRDCETPMHNKLDPALLEGNEKAKESLYDFCDKVQSFLKESVPDIEGEEWEVEDFLAVEEGKSIGESLRENYNGKARRIRRKISIHPHPFPSPDPRKIINVDTIRVPDNKGISVLATPEKSTNNALVRVHIDGGSDESCSGMQWDQLPIRSATKDGEKLEPCTYKGSIIGFNIEELLAGEETLINLELEEGISSLITISCEFSVPK